MRLSFQFLFFSVLACVFSTTHCLSAPATSQVLVDRSTPLAGYKTLLDSISSSDAEATADSIILPVELKGQDRELYGERVVAASQLMWAVSDKLGKEKAAEVRAFYARGAVPRRDLGALNFDSRRSNASGRRGIRSTALSMPQDRHEISFVMGQVDTGWKLNDSGGQATLLEIELVDAPWRNKRMRQALDGLNTGKITDEASLKAVLVPPMVAIAANNGSTDRTNLANIPAAIQAAIDAGDVDAYEDCYIQIGGKKAWQVRLRGEIEIDSKKLDIALHKKFSKPVADELARAGMIVHDTRIFPATIDMYRDYKWNIDGDVARGIRNDFRAWGDFTLIHRDQGLWRIELPSGRLGGGELKWETDNYQRIHDRIAGVLARLDSYPDAGSVREDLDPMRAKSPAEKKQKQKEADDWRQGVVADIKKHKQEAATQRTLMTPQERMTDELQTSFMDQMFVNPQSTTRPCLMFAAENDPSGVYVQARGHLEQAAQQVIDAANHQLFTQTAGQAYQLQMISELQNLETFQSLTWVFNGNHAVGTPPEGFTQLHLKMLKVGGEWKIDITDEIHGDAGKLAATAEQQANEVEKIAVRIRNGKLKSDVDGVAAIKAVTPQAATQPS